MTKEQNTRLVSAMHAIGLTPSRLGELVQVDEKSVERWIRDGREPHSRNRRAAARGTTARPGAPSRPPTDCGYAAPVRPGSTSPPTSRRPGRARPAATA